jgi:hypothetical protein
MSAAPAAVERAKSLHRYAFAQGAGVEDFILTLSDSEGLDLLDWLLEQQRAPDADLELEVREAKETGDPWPLLDTFTLMGLHLAPKRMLA